MANYERVIENLNLVTEPSHVKLPLIKMTSFRKSKLQTDSTFLSLTLVQT